MALSWGCPPTEEYLKIEEKPESFVPLTEEGYLKIVGFENKEIKVFWDDSSDYIIKRKDFELEALNDIVSFKMLAVDNNGKAIYADKDDNPFCIGMSITGVNAGNNVKIVKEGIVRNPGWGLTVGSRYFLGDDGAIMTTVPTSGYIVEVGIAISSDELLLGIKPPIKLL